MQEINQRWRVTAHGPSGTWTKIVWAESAKLAREEVIATEFNRGQRVSVVSVEPLSEGGE